MWAKPNKAELAKIPKLGVTDGPTTKDKLITGHFFCGPCDWYVAEYEPETRMFFGFVNLGDDQCAEWGYFSMEELEKAKISFMEVDFDKYWASTKVCDVINITRAGGSW